MGAAVATAMVARFRAANRNFRGWREACRRGLLISGATPTSQGMLRALFFFYQQLEYIVDQIFLAIL